MDMVSDAGSGGLTEIHAEVEAVGLINFTQGGLTAPREFHQLACGFLRSGVKFRGMFVRNDQQMTADVRVDIENDIIVTGPMKDEGALVIVDAVAQ